MIDITKIVLETDRLVLRAFEPTDLDDFYEYCKVKEVGPMAGWLPHESKKDSKMILDQFIEGKHTFAIVNKANHQVIGSIGLEREKDATCELGYVLSKDYWGQGLMVEACQKVIDYLFKELQMEYLTAGHFNSNLQSKRVIEKLGFHYDDASVFTTYYGKQHESSNYILFNPTFLDLSPLYIQTNRLTIHPLTSNDFEDFYAIIMIPGILENAGHEVVKNEEEARKVFQYYLNTMTLGIYKDDHLIGEVKFKQKKEGAYELGCLLSPNYWGQSIMAEAMNAIIEECFQRFCIPYFSAAIFTYNLQSLKMIEKCHFTFWKKGSYYSFEQKKEIEEIHWIRYRP